MVNEDDFKDCEDFDDEEELDEDDDLEDESDEEFEDEYEDEFDNELDDEDDFDDDFEDEYEEEDVYTISSSEVARIISKEVPNGDEHAQQFGSQFERAYQQICYTLSKFMIDVDELGSILLRFFSDEDDIDQAVKIAQAFLESNIIGLTPKTQFRRIKKNYYIAAKPDLYDQNSDIYYEFKTYKLDEYARTQAKIFSWVLQTPIHLIGWNDPDVEHEVIDGSDLEIPDLPLETFSPTPKSRVREESGPFHQRRGRRGYDYRGFDDYEDYDDGFRDLNDDFGDYDY